MRVVIDMKGWGRLLPPDFLSSVALASVTDLAVVATIYRKRSSSLFLTSSVFIAPPSVAFHSHRFGLIDMCSSFALPCDLEI